MDRYTNFAELAAEQTAGEDYRIICRRHRLHQISIVAPHAGHIERGTSQFASQLAGDDFNLYLFEGLRASYQFENLHITSHRFDEPQCLSLISDSKYVLTIHGCNGKHDTLYLGGRDTALIAGLSHTLKHLPIHVETEGHQWPGKHKKNICNRGLRGMGVQIELCDSLRGGPKEKKLIATLREFLFTLN